MSLSLNGSCKVASPRCDPNRGQRRERAAAASPRCDPLRGQRGQQKSDVHFNDDGKEVDRRSAGSCPSGTAPMMISSASALKVTRSFSCSSPQINSGGAGICRTSSGRALSKTLSGACSSPVAPGVGALLRPPGSVSRRVPSSRATTVTQRVACSSRGASGRGAVVRSHSLSLNVACLHLNVSRMCLTLSHVCGPRRHETCTLS